MRYGNCINGFLGNGMMHHAYGLGIMFIVTTVLIVALLFFLFAYNKKKKSISSSEAEDALKMRYVNGEISEEEYQKMKKMIQ